MAITTLSLIHFLDLNWGAPPYDPALARSAEHFSSTIAILATISSMDSLAATLPLPLLANSSRRMRKQTLRQSRNRPAELRTSASSVEPTSASSVEPSKPKRTEN
jgi:hypothetical protein